MYNKNTLYGWCWAGSFSNIQYALLKAYFNIETTICKGIKPHENKYLKQSILKLFIKNTSLKASPLEVSTYSKKLLILILLYVCGCLFLFKILWGNFKMFSIEMKSIFFYV